MLKMQKRLAKRYARALIKGVSLDKLPTIEEALKSLKSVWLEVSELRATMINPAIPISKRQEVAQDIAQNILPGSQEFKNFLSLLVENHRVAVIPDIADEFSKLYIEIRKLLSLEVTTASDLGQAEISAIQKSINDQLGLELQFSWNSDPAIIGGMIVKSGDRMLDGSVRGRLEKIRIELTR